MRFNDHKSEALNLRVSPTFKETLRKVADLEQRSMANMLEVLLSDYCIKKGLKLSELQTSLTTQEMGIDTKSQSQELA